MQNEKLLDEYMQAVNVMPFNVKAEIVVNQLLDRGVSPEKLQIQLNSAFNRPFRRDVEKALLGTNEERDQLTLLLSRNGIYDLLPEGVVHERSESNGKENIQQLIQQHQIQKREEKEARLFFKPFENELFSILVKVEKQEVALLKNQDRKFQNFLVRFWDINPNLTESQKQFLLKVTPLAYSIKGNIDKICELLNVFLLKQVSYARVFTRVTVPNRKADLGIVLGRNFIVGNTTEELPAIQFQIDSVEESEINDYLKGGKIYNFIVEFLEYLLPAEYEFEINCKMNEDSLFIGFGILGYSSILSF